MQEKIIIAINNSEVTEKINTLLLNEGYQVISTTKSGNELIRMVRNYDVQLVLIGYKLTDMTVMEVYNKIGELTKFLAIVNEPYKSFVKEESDIFCISSPINNIVLLNTIDIIIQSERRINKFKEKVIKLEHKIEDRKIIDKAKGKLMKEKALSEEEAFRCIQKRAMDERKVLRDIAEEILSKV